jgi:rod shape-determining protein MreD
MIDPATLHRLGFAGLFLVLSASVIFFRMLPFGALTGTMPPPDLIVLTGFAWVLRRPDFVPVLLFAALLFVTDLLFLRPPGLAAGLAVIGLEALRARAGLMREQSFLAEWVTVAAVLLLMMLAAQAVQIVFFVDHTRFGLTVLELISNILAYPLVVGVSVLAFRVRRLAPGEHAAEARLV